MCDKLLLHFFLFLLVKTCYHLPTSFNKFNQLHINKINRNFAVSNVKRSVIFFEFGTARSWKDNSDQLTDRNKCITKITKK